MSVGLRYYERVFIRGWSARTCAGDAATSWSACRQGATGLTLDDHQQWLGRCPPGSLTDLLTTCAGEAWAALPRRERAPVLALSTSKGDMQALAEGLRSGALPALARCEMPGMATARALGIRHHLPAPAVAACSTGLMSILAAADRIEDGAAEHGLAGAADRSLTPLLLAGYRAMGILCGTTSPQAFGEPTGFAPAEGAGVVALDQAGPWRLVAGVRLCDASHETHNADPAALRACLGSLWQACPDPDVIVTHGTGTAAGDAYETAGLLSGPWRLAMRLHPKPVIGHCLGASGAVELALALHAPVRRLWKIGLGFGGHLAALGIDRG